MHTFGLNISGIFPFPKQKSSFQGPAVGASAQQTGASLGMEAGDADYFADTILQVSDTLL
jgi:hypothetical protein